METNNKLIVEFLGYIDNGCSEEGFLIDPKTNYDVCIDSLQFNTDWNRLMQVVEKIESSVINSTLNGVIVTMGKNLNHKQYCYIEWGNTNNVRIGHRNLNGFYSKTIEANTLIEAVYIACAEFIKWYNENKI